MNTANGFPATLRQNMSLAGARNLFTARGVWTALLETWLLCLWQLRQPGRSHGSVKQISLRERQYLCLGTLNSGRGAGDTHKSQATKSRPLSLQCPVSIKINTEKKDSDWGRDKATLDPAQLRPDGLQQQLVPVGVWDFCGRLVCFALPVLQSQCHFVLLLRNRELSK